jgi:hypothetical protein
MEQTRATREDSVARSPSLAIVDGVYESGLFGTIFTENTVEGGREDGGRRGD